MQTPIRRIAKLTGRALRLRCPSCGEGRAFESWFRIRKRCSVCGLRLERGEHGYVVGAYMFNIIVAELVFIAIFIAVVAVMWPDPPWTVLQYGGAVMMILMPIIFYPFAKTLFLAFDLLFRPPGPDDYA